ncbi:MAG: hypothetical protein JW999_10785 [Methanotrichaceae archaeon]|nr:hypothetical protein [Methanotrichaceae archaeon]
MDFLNEKKVHYSSGACANCGSFHLASRAGPNTDDLLLCPSCLEERNVSLDDLRTNVRKQFDLNRSPNLRSCFLRLLHSEEVDLAPDGWRTATALGFELKDAGFALQESRQILLQAKGSLDVVNSLLDNIYSKKGHGSLTCEQIRGLNVICDLCPIQYKIARREHKTEVCSVLA